MEPADVTVGDSVRFEEEPTPPLANDLARPKSRTLTIPAVVTTTLAGLRSRWMTPLSWAASMPAVIWMATSSA